MGGTGNFAKNLVLAMPHPGIKTLINRRNMPPNIAEAARSLRRNPYPEQLLATPHRAEARTAAKRLPVTLPGCSRKTMLAHPGTLVGFAWRPDVSAKDGRRRLRVVDAGLSGPLTSRDGQDSWDV